MRGNEPWSGRLGPARQPYGATIPMRGNEAELERENAEAAAATIPMRGNERKMRPARVQT